MHVVVLGAGVTGVTTAWCLARAGYEVTVIDSEDQAACGTTHANAAQLSYSFVDSLATPDFVPEIPGILLGRDIGARVRLNPQTIVWGLRFLAECRPRRSRASTIRLLELARESATVFGSLLDDVPLEFDYRNAGKTVLLDGDEALDHAQENVELKRRYGSDIKLLSPEEALAIEPTLADMNETYSGVLYSANDTVGDACAFSRDLADHLETQLGVQFRFSTRVEHIEVTGGRATGVITRGERLGADAFVVCLGASSAKLLKPLGIHLPILPVRGYSLTLPPGECAPSTSVTSLKNHFVFTRLGSRVRVAGFTDFAGFDTRHDALRIAELLELARASAPLAADYDAEERHEWGGFRPMTPDCVPRTGPTRIANLYTNTGHGMLGWTLAPATAAVVMREIEAARPVISPLRRSASA